MSSRATRDLGLQRVGTGTRWLAVGALVAGGVLSAAVAKAVPGKSGHPATTSPVAPSTSTTAGAADGGTTATTPPLSVPVQAPQPVVTAPPVVSSGGS